MLLFQILNVLIIYLDSFKILKLPKLKASK
jgi:hypothetical protein